MKLSQEYLKETYIYDVNNGKLYLKKRLGPRKKGSIVGTIDKDGYVVTQLNKKSYKVHRIIYFMFYGSLPESIDHINHNRSDNRIENLRPASPKQNARNRGISDNSHSGVLGVFWRKRERVWEARVTSNQNKRICLGTFDLFEDAVKARVDAEEKYGYHKNHGKNIVNSQAVA